MLLTRSLCYGPGLLMDQQAEATTRQEPCDATVAGCRTPPAFHLRFMIQARNQLGENSSLSQDVGEMTSSCRDLRRGLHLAVLAFLTKESPEEMNGLTWLFCLRCTPVPAFLQNASACQCQVIQINHVYINDKGKALCSRSVQCHGPASHARSQCGSCHMR